MLLNKEQILSADDLTYKNVEVPEWNGTVRVRTMTGLERMKFEDGALKIKGDSVELSDGSVNIICRLLALTICGDDGERIFGDDEMKALAEKSVRPLLRLFKVAQELNGIGEDEVEELEKNSETVPSDS